MVKPTVERNEVLGDRNEAANKMYGSLQERKEKD